MESKEKITLQTVISHIKRHKLWDNDPLYYINQMPDSLALVIQFYWYEVLNWCGCGTPETALMAIASYLELQDRDITDRESYDQWKNEIKEAFPPDGDDGALYNCLAYSLDSAKFTEHGSSICACWLTDDGKYFLWAIREAEKNGILDGVLHNS